MKEEFLELAKDFQDESSELLDAMEEHLLEIQESGMNDENINAVFRAAHTIKGSGRMFELDYLVQFTHAAENLLDEIRKKHIVMSEQILSTFFEVKDQMQALVNWSLTNNTSPSGDLEQNSLRLISILGQFLNGETPSQIVNTSVVHDEPQNVVSSSNTEDVVVQAVQNDMSNSDKPNRFSISISFDGKLISSGTDPMNYVRNLRGEGSVHNIQTRFPEIQDVMNFNAASSHIDITFEFETALSVEAILNIFEPILNLCRIEVVPIVANIEPIATISTSNNSNSEPITVLRNDSKEIENKIEKQEAVASGVKQQPAGEIKSSPTLRVEAHKIDTLINLIGEMVIVNSNVVQQIQNRGDKELMESISAMSRMLEDIREASMQTRMVPIAETFSKFKRIIRDLSKELGKDIELEIIGGDTELDKTVTEKIYDPLIHLVRNSLDHGIESPDARLQAGKNKTGKLTLKAFHEAGNIAIQIKDDGKGLNVEFLKAKAIEKGLLDPNAEISEKEAFGLIMMPGFSTAQKVSNISGRGVGMDVVRKNVEELRGTIDINSTEGVGTVITIRLPLTLAIIDGFLTKAGDAYYVFPLDMVVECIELTNDQIGAMSDNNYINLRGTLLNLLDLREFFEIKRSTSKRENILIVRFGEQTLGIIVNELKGELQTVIKPIGPVFKNVKGIGGATILGSGEVAMILDIPMLMQCINMLD